MAIAEEHIITRSGKKYVLYAGLLEEAHARGLRSIITEILQIPTPDNGGVAIVKALADIEGEDGITCRFTGIGDASPENVAKNIVPHVIRMAETRAKARALRDAINVAEALADDPIEADEAPASEGVDVGADLLKIAQARNLERLLEIDARQLEMTYEERKGQMETYLEKPLKELTVGEANIWIRRLEAGIEKRSR